MNNDIAFQIVCAKCGCLSIKIEAPLKASREDVVYCGDCGSSRGTVGELRDLAVQRYPGVVFSTPSVTAANGDRTDAQPATTCPSATPSCDAFVNRSNLRSGSQANPTGSPGSQTFTCEPRQYPAYPAAHCPQRGPARKEREKRPQ
jgi:hypothetical protein